MQYQLTIPARINILGNPGDANEGDFATLSAAIDLYAGAEVEPAAEVILEIASLVEQPITGQDPHSLAVFPTGTYPLPYNGSLDLLKGAVNTLYRFSPEFRGRYSRQGIRLSTWTTVPRQSGLGGSTLFVLLALAGLREVYSLDQQTHNNYVIAELAQRTEADELKIICGYADRYVPLFGGLAYIDYRGKLSQVEIRQEPYATYERLDPWLDEFPIVAISSGITHNSGDVHGRMRPCYLAEYYAWQAEKGDPPPMIRFMSGAWETAWRGKIALLESDWFTFGRMMNENHRLVDQMMVYCGFDDGAGWANNRLVEAALQNGALGAKLTGAGGGGSVFALVHPGQEESMMEVWRKEAQTAGLGAAWIYRPSLDRAGLVIKPTG